MTNIGHFRAAARMLDGAEDRGLVGCGSARRPGWTETQLATKGCWTGLEAAGARVEIPGCTLCMGNQARVADNAVVFSTSTRNFDNRMGDGAQVFLGSAELGAACALLGRIPTVEEYFQLWRTRIAGREGEIYRYLSFDQMPEYRA